MRRLACFVVACVAALAPAAHADLRVFACEPEWGALAEVLGAGAVRVFTATTGRQDPHHIEARPSLIAQVRRADLVVCTGAELEVAWLPLLLRQAGNSRVQPGTPGYLEAADHVTLLERPAKLDRAEGDVHAAGNPHIQTDPRNIARVATVLAQRYAQLDPARAARYQQAHSDFASRWQASIVRWERTAAPLKGKPVVSQHKSWVYLYEWLGLREVAVLEPKPGIPATSGHLAQVLKQLAAQPASMVVYAAYQDPQAARWLAERTALRAVQLPYTVGGSDRARDLFGLFDDTIDRLVAGSQ